MNYSSVVSSKGQVTIPQEVRVHLGLNEGDRLEFTIEGDHTVIRPVRARKNSFEAYAGVLGTFAGGAEEVGDALVFVCPWPVSGAAGYAHVLRGPSGAAGCLAPLAVCFSHGCRPPRPCR